MGRARRSASRHGRLVRPLIGVLCVGVALVASRAGGSPVYRSVPVGAAFQYQLQVSDTGSSSSGGIDVSLCARQTSSPGCVRARVFDIDLYGPTGAPNRAAVEAIHAQGGYAICYVDAGTWENWRPDAKRFAATLLGRSNGWPGERWLDVRHIAKLLPIMSARVQRCAKAGFDAVEFDNVDAYSNASGFAITGADQLRYNEALAALAHRFHLAAGLKNDYAQASVLVHYFDFAIDESCVQYHECSLLAPFVRAAKAVYDVEYSSSPSRFCPIAAKSRVTAIAKALALRATPWSICPTLARST
ncbi:MAG: endo alpha-1,4 polygalactosaminidase [Acidimicrobiaceae bacterium]|nr:endo alpha-1,4 polygalactosaminidase [Acidimicrobiaceae bacterium]